MESMKEPTGKLCVLALAALLAAAPAFAEKPSWGCLLYDWLPKMRAEYLRPLMERFAQLLKEHQAFTPVFGIL